METQLKAKIFILLVGQSTCINHNSLDEFLSIYESEIDDDTGSENGDINELPSMPPPPEDQSFMNTMQGAMDCINNFTKSHGYVLTTFQEQRRCYSR
jgi:hypothetical protein